MLHVGYLEILETPNIESISNQVKNVPAPLASSLRAVPARNTPLRRAQFILAPPRPVHGRALPRLVRRRKRTRYISVTVARSFKNNQIFESPAQKLM